MISKRIILITALMALSPAAKGSSLADAYRQELEQLTAERGALAHALQNSEQRTAAARIALATEIEDLTARLTRLRAENAISHQRAAEGERGRSLAEQERQLHQLKEQIQAWMHTRGIDGLQVLEAPLPEIFGAALAYVEQRGSLQVQRDHEYFSARGVAQRGDVLQLGRVGALTLTESMRPLVVVPDGSLKVVPEVQFDQKVAGDARAVGVVLFDPREGLGGPHFHPESFIEWLQKGGALMWPIALLGLLAFGLSCERGVALSLAVLHIRRFRRQLAHERRAIIGRWQTAKGARDVLLRPALLVLQARDTDVAHLEEAASEALARAQHTLVRGVSFLGVVASVAPLLGLLGTVTGMISTFAVITEHGTGDPRLLSGGISEALLTTQFGLMVAIPALLLHTGLHRTAHGVLRQVEMIAVDLMDDVAPSPDNFEATG